MQNKERWPDVEFHTTPNGCIEITNHLTTNQTVTDTATEGFIAQIADGMQAEVDAADCKTTKAEELLASLDVVEDNTIKPDPDLM